jgi:plasmid maintenance system killer protein
MKLVYTEKAVKDYVTLTTKLQALTDKQLDSLIKDLRYPSLHAKKYNQKEDIWQIIINKSYRLYFQIVDDAYVILTITKHPK